MSGQPSVLQVVILRDGLLVGTEVFVPGTYALGSDASSDLRLDDTSVSPRHAMLYFQNGRTAIQDAGGGTSGVFVNGHQVTACEIRSVDEVLCGPFVLKTRILNQRPVESKPQPPPEVAALFGNAGAPPAAPPHAPANGAPHGFAPQHGAPAQQAAHAQQQAQQAAYAQQQAAQAQQAAYAQQQAQQAAYAQQQAAQAQQAAYAQQQAQQAAYAQQQAAQAQQAAYAQQQAQQAAYAQQQAAQAQQAAHAQQQAAYAQKQAQQAQHAAHAQQQAAHAQHAAQAQHAAHPQALHAPQQGAHAQAGHAQAAHPQAAHAQPAPATRAPPQGVPAGTVPSTRRRPPSEVMPSLLVADDLLADVDLEAAAPSGPLLHDKAVATRPTHAPKIGPGKGASQLYMELYWGAVRRDARRFAPNAKKPVKAALEEQASMPLWGFTLPEGDAFTLAESVNGNYRLFVPPGTDVEKGGADGRFAPVTSAALESDGSRRFVTLRDGAAARLTQGKMSLVAYAAPVPERIFVNPLKGLPWLTLFFLAIFGGGLGYFIATRPQGPATADFTQKNLPPVALRLIAPEPKKKEEAKKKLEALKKKEPVKEKPVVAEKAPPKPVKQQAPQPKAVAAAPESKALKALAKLSAAGPAANDLLAAVDKLGSGPGSKNVKQTNYKLSGLIGKAPIANAGLGTFGLGGGGKGGGATLGAELLRGKGGGGIGALGAGGVGKGAVGGTVTRATARSISSTQGTVDREAVAKVINSHLNEVHGCYERALLKDPGLAGKVVLEWSIGLNGRVASAKTKSSTLRNASVEACILSSLKGWQFPTPKGGLVIITYPFLFNSVGY
ncbi:AgmX/PglI C-terminal domain-containing protein [Corallococcus terminator]|uniref:FHA domain-containing protein n=1 Tax=Corallococcus terminator TaxID=2316733 RepID=A0A3A8I4A8_9BACT|nr:AgmX/PglI C-terminal domain-containing protein [Corallococcus terminator]RKG74584.1 FHA domain-containing protein [Corallococcus terminator]